MPRDRRKLCGVWAVGAGLGLVIGLLMPWVDHPGITVERLGAEATDLWWLVGLVGLAVIAVGISLLSSQRSASQLGWALLVLGLVALVVVLNDFVESAGGNTAESEFDESAPFAGSGMLLAMGGAFAAVVDAIVMLVGRKSRAPVGPPPVGPPPPMPPRPE